MEKLKKHYEGKIEPIDLIIGNKLDFVRGSIVKYACRAGKKEGEAEKDILKIIDYALLLAKQEDIDVKDYLAIQIVKERIGVNDTSTTTKQAENTWHIDKGVYPIRFHDEPSPSECAWG